MFLPSAFAQGFTFVNDEIQATNDEPAAESMQKRTVDENSEEIKRVDDDDDDDSDDEEIGSCCDKRKKRHSERERERQREKILSNWMVVLQRSYNNICSHLRKPKMKTNHWSGNEKILWYFSSFSPGHAGESGDGIHHTNDLRISQPKYSQLLKELDFSQTRMVKERNLPCSLSDRSFALFATIQVDVTELLLNNLDSPTNFLSPDENENLNKTSGDEKYQSLSSAQASGSSDEPDEQLTASGNDQLTAGNRRKKDGAFTEAANEIQNDLNNLAAMIQGVSLISTDDQDNEKSAQNDDGDDDKTEPSKVPGPKRATFDEDDDTSKQATQNYDLNDFEQEVRSRWIAFPMNELFRALKYWREKTYSWFHDRSPRPLLNFEIDMHLTLSLT